jgi:hypothetical protein
MIVHAGVVGAFGWTGEYIVKMHRVGVMLLFAKPTRACGETGKVETCKVDVKVWISSERAPETFLEQQITHSAVNAPPPLPSRHPTRVTRHTHARSLALYFVAITRQRHLFVSSTVALLDIFIKSTTHLIHICCRRLLFPLIDRSAAEQVVGDVGVCVLCFAYRRDGPSNAFVASNLQRGDEHFPGIVYRSALPIARSSFS